MTKEPKEINILKSEAVDLLLQSIFQGSKGSYINRINLEDCIDKIIIATTLNVMNIIKKEGDIKNEQ